MHGQQNIYIYIYINIYVDSSSASFLISNLTLRKGQADWNTELCIAAFSMSSSSVLEYCRIIALLLNTSTPVAC